MTISSFPQKVTNNNSELLILDCDMLDGNEKLHPCSGLLSEHTLHATLVKTNSPIYGILMQPYSNADTKKKTFIMVEHVKFL